MGSKNLFSSLGKVCAVFHVKDLDSFVVAPFLPMRNHQFYCVMSGETFVVNQHTPLAFRIAINVESLIVYMPRRPEVFQVSW